MQGTLLQKRAWLTITMDIQAYLNQIEPWIIEIRRHLHAIPEPGFQEYKTSAFIARTLTEIGYTPMVGIAETGIKAVLDTGRAGKTILLRADMDALNMSEETGLSFASVHEGYVHGCGHDAHLAMLLGAAKLLWQHRQQLSGKVIFIFQPAEEGLGGARRMLEEGVLENEKVDYCFAQHVWPTLPSGTFGIREGRLLAAVNHFSVIIHGKGGHGAMPHHCVDALDVGTRVVNGLQGFVSRQLNPLEPVVLTIGTFNSGTACNIIPEKAVLTGSIRTYNIDIWKSWKAKLEQVIDGICSSMGASFEFAIDEGYPPVINGGEAVRIASQAAIKLVGVDNVVEPEPAMCAEDISFFHQHIKNGCLVLLGCGTEPLVPLHSPRFFCPEEVLSTGAGLYSQLVFDLLGNSRD